MNKYTIAGLNHVVSKWMTNQSNSIEDKVFDEVFRDDDDTAPQCLNGHGVLHYLENVLGI